MWEIDEIFNVIGKKKSCTEEIIITGISIDSRTIKKGEIFIALEGVNYDGHKFIGQALNKGASLVIVNAKKYKNKFPIITVRDTKATLINLARYARNRIKNLLVIAVTGSSGKTTLKEWLFKILKDDYSSHCNFGNFNNEIGMPLTLLNMPKNTQICILEVGMNNRGEIKKLTEIAQPNIKIITNIGVAHIGNLKSKKNIALEKSEIFKYYSKNGISIIPRDDEFFEYLSKKASKFKNEKVLSFGRNIKSTFRIIDSSKQKKDVKFFLSKKNITLTKHVNLSGWEENISIILGLIETLELKVKKLENKIIKLQPIEGRGKVYNLKISNMKIILIDESYNSNPNSLKLSIDNLKSYKNKHNKIICIIGDMLELGKESSKMHGGIVKHIKKIQPNIVFTVGKSSELIEKNLPKKFYPSHFYDYKQVFSALMKVISNGDVVMIKGSNSSNVNKISQELLEAK